MTRLFSAALLLSLLGTIGLQAAPPSRGHDRDEDRRDYRDRDDRDRDDRHDGRDDDDERRHFDRDHGRRGTHEDRHRFEHDRDEYRRDEHRAWDRSRRSWTEREVESERVREEYRERVPAISELSRSIDAEMRDIAAAISSLNQSYGYKGFRNGDHAWVAGSTYIDRQCAVRIRQLEERLRALEHLRTREREQYRREERVEIERRPAPRPRVEKHARVESRRDDCFVYAWRAGERLDGKRRGECTLQRDGSLGLTDGSCLFSEKAADSITAACRASNTLTIEALFTPASDDCRGPARILSLSNDSSSRNFTLGQEADRLVLRLRTTETGDNGTNPEVSLVRLERGRQHHVVITYAEGRLICRLNGEQVMETGAIRGDFSNWSDQQLVLGDEANGGRDWPGTLRSFSISNCLPGERPRR